MLVWLLSFYVIIGLVETMIALPREHAARKKREEAAAAVATERSSIPPT